MKDMLCKHVKTKEKLVSWAIDSRYGHEQGFTTKECCENCGKVVNTEGNQHFEDQKNDKSDD